MIIPQKKDDAMHTYTLTGHVKTAEMEWKPLVESGVDTTGISVKTLRVDTATGRAPVFLLRFEPGASYPYHNHPAGEELFVLSGSCVIEGTTVEAGDYLYTPWIKACGAQSDGMHDPVSGSQRGRDPLNLSALSACRHQPGAGERVAVPEPPSQRAALDIRRTKSPEVFSGGRRLDVGDHEAPARPEHPPCLTDGLRLRHTGERARQELAKVATPNNKIGRA